MERYIQLPGGFLTYLVGNDLTRRGSLSLLYSWIDEDE